MNEINHQKETSEELRDWDKIISRGDNIASVAGQSGVVARAAQKITISIVNLSNAIQQLDRVINRSSNFINRALSQLDIDISNASNNLKQMLTDLNKNISDFNESTIHISNKANKLILWYVILTAIIAMATVINAGIIVWNVYLRN